MITCYYRSYQYSVKPKLRIIAADFPPNLEGIKEFEQEVMEQLHDEMEVFLRPILFLIKGGKV